MKTYLPLLVVLMTACAVSAPQPTQAAIVCTPNTFTLLPHEQGGYELRGKLDVPTAGYSYKMGDGEPLRLVLTAPDGMAAQVISQVDVNASISAGELPITIAIEKPFAWGPDFVLCERNDP